MTIDKVQTLVDDAVYCQIDVCRTLSVSRATFRKWWDKFLSTNPKGARVYSIGTSKAFYKGRDIKRMVMFCA